MFDLAWPWLLLLAPLPIFLRLLLPASPPADTALLIPFFSRLAALAGRDKQPVYRLHLRLLVPALIWLLLVFAASRPQWLEPLRTLNPDGRNSMLAVDLSASMLTRDVAGSNENRFTITRTLLLQLLDRRPDDRFGLILFASQAFLQSPLTFDHDSLRHWLHTIEPGIAGDNTAIGDAIGLGIKRLRDLPASDKNLILLTDGANNSGIMPPRTAARFAAREGIRIHSLGIGEAGDGNQDGPDLALLQDIAWLTGGYYLHVDSTASLADAIRFFDNLPASNEPARTRWQTRELYHWPLAAALSLALLAGLTTLAGSTASRRREQRQ